LVRAFGPGVDIVAKRAANVSPKIRAKARAVLEFAEQERGQTANWLELSNALFGPGGKATVAFPSERERTAFCKTAEYKRILAVMDRLPAPPVKEVARLTASAPSPFPLPIGGEGRVRGRAPAPIGSRRPLGRSESRRSQLEPALPVETRGSTAGGDLAAAEVQRGLASRTANLVDGAGECRRKVI
jgi:hypothetical protein